MFTNVWLILTLFLLSPMLLASPKIQYWQLDNGTDVYYVNAPELPMVDVRLVFDAGAARDGDKPGLAQMTISLLDEGTGDKTTDEVANTFADVGAVYGSSSQRDMAVVSLRSLTEDKALRQALAMFSQVVGQPSFPTQSFDRIKRQFMLSFQAENQSPQAIASRTFYENVFSSHPYRNMPAGNPESIEAISLADLRAFYQQYYVTNNAVVVIVGDINRQKADSVAQQVTSYLKRGKHAQKLPVVQPLSSPQTIVTPFPSSQTSILMGQIGMSRKDADYFPLYVGNHILGGGGLVSLLNDEIREKRGLSYGVSSYFSPMQQAGPFILGLKTRNDQAQQALDILKTTLSDFIRDGPTDEQLIAAKQNITGGFALRVDSNSKIAGYLAMIGFYKLPLNYLDNFNDKVDAVTVADIKDAFQRRIHPDKMLTVLVGDETQKKTE